MATLAKGETIDDTYEVLFFIGEGAFGETYRVKHKFLGTQVLKLFKEKYVQETDISVVTKEARILSKITHPNIVRVFETNSFSKNDKELYYLTMGFVSGETLGQLLARKGQLLIPVAISVQKDIMAGLQCVQEQPSTIVHRDINPDNILISYEKHAPVGLIADFGLSQSIDQLSNLPGAAGRYPYFAPECFFGAYLPASDIFSAGIVLYQMITGRHPWDYDLKSAGDDHKKITTAILSARKSKITKPSVYNAACNAELDRIILKALSKNLDKRYRSASVFLNDLIEFEQNPKEAATRIAVNGSTSTPVGSSNGGYKVRKAGKGFDEIAGMEDLKETLYHEVILPLNDKALYEQYRVSIPNGMLLYGPPGCGKTFIAQKFAQEIKYNFVEVKPSDLASIYVHGTQEKIGTLFRDAEESAPTIIFIDEVDAVLPSREGDLSQSYASEVNEFLAQMTECHKRGIFVIAATNRPEKIDPAVLRTGRMDKVVYLPPPDVSARKAMFELHLKDRPVGNDLNIDRLAELTEYYVASDISFMVNEASRSALKERTTISQLHLESAIENNQPSISRRQLNAYETFMNKRNFS